MSLENSISKTLYTGNGVTREFSFPFKVWQASQVRVILAEPSTKAGEGGTSAASLSGTETDVTAQVSVSLSPTGGTVTFATAPAPGATLAILRQMPFVQEDRYITGTRFDPHEIEDALDIACAERQELRELALRHLAVPATSAKTPAQVMTEIFDTVATANEYAVQAQKTFEEVQRNAAQVASNKASVDVSLASINASEAAVTRLARQVMDYSDELEMVAQNMPGIQMVDQNQDAIAAIAADLQGWPVYEFDGGWIGEAHQPMNGVGGVLRICAENIDIIRQVAGSLENSEALLALADDVAEIGGTDYAGIDDTGEAGGAGESGSSTASGNAASAGESASSGVA